MERKRYRTRTVRVGSTFIGGDQPIRVQSMITSSPDDLDNALREIEALKQEGCELVRVAVPQMSSVDNLKRILKAVDIPIIADIHFNYRIAIAAIEAGAAKIRVNPGNIGGKEKFREVLRAARENGTPIRIGVNAGSLEKEVLEKYGGRFAEALVESVLKFVHWAEEAGVENLVLSAKSSDIPTTIEANRRLRERTDYPLHIGITEAGTKWSGTIRSCVGMGILLYEGIGDTIRVSLTADPVEEVRVAWELLSALKLRRRGPVIVSCPTCGRCQVNLIEIADKVERALRGIKQPLKVAVMGCVVNGPGEAQEADVGIACGQGSAVLFRRGEIIARVPEERLVETVVEEVRKIVKEE